jgi:hypothetical protein
MSITANFRRVPTSILDEVRTNPALISGVLDARAPVDADLDIDKTWAGLHFLLTGDPTGDEAMGPLAFILAGEPIGDIDVGYGPARGFAPAEVRTIATALAPITAEALRGRFDASTFARENIYPEIWDEGEEALSYLLEHFEDLKDFVTKTAESNAAMLVYLA